MQNTIVGMSTLIWVFTLGETWVESACQLGMLLTSTVGSAVAWMLCEHLAERFEILKKYSPDTFLHEGAHWAVAKVCRARPTFVLGQPYIEMLRPPTTPIAISFTSLAPLGIWWSGLLICVGTRAGGGSFFPIGVFILLTLTPIGMPSNFAERDEPDWRIANRGGSRIVNHGMLAVGIALEIAGYLAFRRS